MATNSTVSYYKNTKRLPRIQYSEESFKLGMNFTNSPLLNGSYKELINFDFKDSGEALKPRAGLKALELGAFEATQIPVMYDNQACLSAGKDCTEEDTFKYRQLIVGSVSDNLKAGTKLYTGTANIYTVNINPAPNTEIPGVGIYPMVVESLSTNPVLFKRPKEASIHNIPVQDSSYIAKQVGTFAFNNSYYYFDGDSKLCYTNYTTGKYSRAEVPISPITPKEAVMWGYNMLEENPYNFANSESSTLQLQGMLPFDSSDEIVMSPRTNQTVYLKCFYSGAKTDSYKIVWEWKEPSADTWTSFQTSTLALTDLPDMTAEFSSPRTEILVRVSAYKVVSGTPDTLATQVLTVGFNFDKELYGSVANIDPVEYDLSTASGMTFWQNRLVLYGLAKDPTILFTSDVNNPGYFPYPAGVDLYDEPIIHATPFLDKLIVFTSSKLYLLTLSTDGTSWTRKMIQGNLAIKDWDVHLIQVVKNMVFFKSGNYFYMVVPKASSTTGELTIAPVSKTIETLLDNFASSIAEIADLLFAYRDPLTLIHYYNFLDFEDVHNVYVFKTTKDVLLNVDLLYNTVLRTWRMHTYESQDILTPYKQDATKKGMLSSIVGLQQRWKDAEDIIQVGKVMGLQFYQFDETTAKDFYIPVDTQIYTAIDNLISEIEDPTQRFELIHKFKNYQLLDSGYREHNSDYNKRYRELQLKFNNISQQALTFLTEFSIDGDMRKSFYKYNVIQDTDPVSPNYGTISLERVPVDAEMLPGSTVLAEDESDTNAWTLDSSMFPEAFLWKVRIPISGKGYAPKLRLLSFNEELFEMLGVTWVFRMMYSR